MDKKTPEQTEQSQPTKFRDLYTRITSHLEHHTDIVIVGKKMEVDTHSDFVIDYYVAPNQEMSEVDEFNRVDELNRLLQSLQPQDLTPSKVREFTFESSVGFGKNTITFGVLEYKSDIGELRIMKKLGIGWRGDCAQLLLVNETFYSSPSIAVINAPGPGACHQEKLTLDQAISSIDDGSLIITSQYTAGIRIRLLPSKEYAAEVLKGVKDEDKPYGMFLHFCLLDGEHLILPHEYRAWQRQQDQEEQQDKPVTKGIIKGVLDYLLKKR